MKKSVRFFLLEFMLEIGLTRILDTKYVIGYSLNHKILCFFIVFSIYSARIDIMNWEGDIDYVEAA